MRVGAQPRRLPYPTQAGCAQLTVTRARDRSVACRVFATSPLRLLTPRNHGHAAWVYTSSYGGGLVDGDAIAMQVTVGRNACAFLSTQASTKVYRSPHGTIVETRAKIEDAGVLIVAPDPVVCFAQSRYHQTQRFELAGHAGLVLVDWLSSGRRESGERWAFDEWVSRTIVRLDGRLLVHDVQALRVTDGDLSTRLGEYDVIAAVIILGRPFSGEVEAVLRNIGGQPVGRCPAPLVSASRLGDTGCVLRIAGRSVEQVGRTMRDYLGFLPKFLGDNPWARKW